ncbi:MAG: hypothetical protein ACRC6E_11025, partial [Fusobacteriaceae bacterium]
NMYRSLCGNSSLWRVIQTKVVSNGYKIELYEKGMILLTFVNFDKKFIKFYKYLVTGDEKWRAEEIVLKS